MKRIDLPLSTGEENVRFSCKYRGRHEGDLPADTPLFLSFSCFGNYEAFQRRNPDARLVLRKFTDK